MPSSPSLTRRSLVAGLAAAPLLGIVPHRALAARAGSLQFDILRNDSPIGEHRLTAEQTAGGLRVAIDTDIRVRVLGVTAYRYRHESREDWADGQDGLTLVGLRSRTDDNGSDFRVEGEAEGADFRVEGSEGPVVAPADVVPASYWNPLVLRRRRLLNTKRGTLFEASAEPRGEETIESGGQRVRTHRAFIAGDPAVHLWFDDEQRVRRLAFESRGEFIDYRLASMGPFGFNERVF